MLCGTERSISTKTHGTWEHRFRGRLWRHFSHLGKLEKSNPQSPLHTMLLVIRLNASSTRAAQPHVCVCRELGSMGLLGAWASVGAARAAVIRMVGTLLCLWVPSPCDLHRRETARALTSFQRRARRGVDCRQLGKLREKSAQLVWAFAVLPRQVVVMRKGGIYLPLPSFLWLLYSAVLQIIYCLEKEWLWQAASPASWPSRSGRREDDELLSWLCGP